MLQQYFGWYSRFKYEIVRKSSKKVYKISKILNIGWNSYMSSTKLRT